jgi:hypothetical protein
MSTRLDQLLVLHVGYSYTPTWCPCSDLLIQAALACPSSSLRFRHCSTAFLLAPPLACNASSASKSKQRCADAAATAESIACKAANRRLVCWRC